MEHSFIAAAWGQGKTRRWHANPVMAALGQTNHDHIGGCLVLLYMLVSRPSSRLVKAVLFHDAGERWTGDEPWTFKQDHPELAAQKAAAETSYVVRLLGYDPIAALTPTELAQLKLIDWLDAYANVALFRPDELRRNRWPTQVSTIRNAAQDLGLLGKVDSFMEAVRDARLDMPPA